MDLDDLLHEAEEAAGKAVAKGKDVVEDRGGTDALKADAAEVQDAVTGDGSLTDKAKEVVEAVKDPGEKGP